MSRFCHLTGVYYCGDCQPTATVHAIPARIVHNWDFERRPVCGQAAAFLGEFRHHPFVDMRLLNPAIYAAVAPMAHLQSLRIQLNFLRAYLTNCRTTTTATADGDEGTGGDGDAFDAVRQLLHGRHHLYENVHRYAVADLLQLPRLADDLTAAVRTARSHVAGCAQRCAAKGFVCEMCGDAQRVVYPFDVATTFRCEPCGAVFHAECCRSGDAGDGDEGGAERPCPRCERRRRRQQRRWEEEEEEDADADADDGDSVVAATVAEMAVTGVVRPADDIRHAPP